MARGRNAAASHLSPRAAAGARRGAEAVGARGAPGVPGT